MPLTIELTAEQSAKLERLAQANGVKPAEYVARLVDDFPEAPQGLLPGETLLDACKRLGFAGAFDFEPRADGREWSEVEGLD